MREQILLLEGNLFKLLHQIDPFIMQEICKSDLPSFDILFLEIIYY